MNRLFESLSWYSIGPGYTVPAPTSTPSKYSLIVLPSNVPTAKWHRTPETDAPHRRSARTPSHDRAKCRTEGRRGPEEGQEAAMHPLPPFDTTYLYAPGLPTRSIQALTLTSFVGSSCGASGTTTPAKRAVELERTAAWPADPRRRPEDRSVVSEARGVGGHGACALVQAPLPNEVGVRAGGRCHQGKRSQRCGSRNQSSSHGRSPARHPRPERLFPLLGPHAPSF